MLVLERLSGELYEEFILRAEQLRMKTAASREVVMARVWHSLSGDVKEKLDEEVDRLGVEHITWQMVVLWARKKLQRGVYLRQEQAVNQPLAHAHGAPPSTQLPPPPPPAAPARAPPPQANSGAIAGNRTGGSRVSKTCWICADLECPNNQGHTAEQCFANPKSPEFRADIRSYRLRDLQKKGKKPTARYLALGEPPNTAPGANNVMTVEEMSGLLAQLHLTEDLTTEVLEQMIGQDQAQAAQGQEMQTNFVGMYQHVDDGSYLQGE